MNSTRIISLLVFLFCISYSNSKYDNIAFCLDSKGQVVRKGLARSGKIFRGDVIYNGDKITVGVNGFISFKNIHERSEIRIFKNSSIKVFTKKNRLNGQKEFEVVIFGGRVIIDKNEINNNRLIVTSPSSNIYLRNSHFLIHCVEEQLFNQPSYCVFTSIEGNILVENSKSKKFLFLKNGDSIVSTPKGDFYQINTFQDDENIRNSINMRLISF